jgi:uracil-DNA glycosylase
MSDPATDYLHATLRALNENGATLRAPREALARLATTARNTPEAAPQNPARRTAPARMEVRPPEPAPIAAPAPAADFAHIAPAEGTKAARLAAMRGPVLACTKCPHLVKSRTQVVFGVGNPEAALMFVGEAPGEDEDRQGEPFVGKAGQLLTKIIETMGLRREDVYIGNVLKCRPDMPPGMPGNRKPRPDEMQVCLPYLREQIEIIQPRAIVALGATALEGLTGQNIPVGRVRGKWQEFQGIPLMVTYHPAYLLRNQALGEKRKVWEDILAVMEKLEMPISEKQRGFFLR